jgi:CubicO group peptidase (beta-lactamase class C family)
MFTTRPPKARRCAFVLLCGLAGLCASASPAPAADFPPGWLPVDRVVSSAVPAEPAPTALTDAQRALEYSQLAPAPERFLLTGETFPAFAFAQPERARELLGAHKSTVVYYDSDYRIVTKATKPGRYGAVVEIIPAPESKLPPTRRFFTLYRLPDRADLDAQSPALVARLKALRWNFRDLPLKDTADSARELAGLHEVPRGADPDSFYQQSWEKDRQWWIGLKRRLYGFDKRFPDPFPAPRAVAGKPATAVREGTAPEAGMKPDAARKLDELLTRWVAGSDTGFDVCVVRHGVVVLHKAYGSRSGKPLTTTTLTSLTSTSKLVTATALMQLVDRGWFDLDQPITELPGPLFGLKTQKPVTLRALYTHTAFSVNIDPTPDMEERLAAVLPHLPIGAGYQYTGTSLELAWAIASMATGESLSVFSRDHLFAPLECPRTEVRNTGGATQSTSLEMARVFQMLLNRGSYGDKRLLADSVVAEMLPRRHTKTLGPFANDRPWGIGTHPWKTDDFSPLAFGHAGYFKSTAFIDPAHDLVVVMLRQGAGTNDDKYHPQFLKAIADGMTDRLPGFPTALTLSDRDVPPGKDRFTVEAVVENPGPADAVLEYRYDTAGTGWRFEPPSARVALPAKGKATVRVEVRFDPERPAPLPKLHAAIYPAAGPTPLLPVEYWLRPILRRGVVARRLDRAPVIDGAVGAKEYGDTPDTPSLRETHGRKEPEYGARFRVGYDDKAVYVAVTAAEKAPGKLPQAGKTRDDPLIRKDDHIELVIDPSGRGKDRHQFVVNLAGVRYDARRGDVKWDADWSVVVGCREDEYGVEFRIPFEALGVTAPRPGDVWALNVLRGRGTRGPKWELFSQWVMTYADFDSPTHVGELTFK